VKAFSGEQLEKKAYVTDTRKGTGQGPGLRVSQPGGEKISKKKGRKERYYLQSGVGKKRANTDNEGGKASGEIRLVGQKTQEVNVAHTRGGGRNLRRQDTNFGC